MKFSWLAAALLLTACQFSLAGDVTPPPISISPYIEEVAIEYPTSLPDAENGETIYVQSCLPCHGPTGLGDGAQAADLPFAPAPIGSAALADVASPNHWYQLISVGNIDRYMPPFSAMLNIQERWDVLSFVYSLSATPTQLQQGGELANKYADQIGSLFDEATLPETAQFPRVDIETQLHEALPELTPDEQKALAIYLQSIALGFSDSTELAATPDGETRLGSISGQVVNGTDGELHSDLQAILFAYDHAQQAFTQTTEVTSNGSFTFSEVPIAENRTFFVEVDYAGLSYFSDFLESSSDTEMKFEGPVTIYETTTDNSNLAIETLTLVFDFTQAGRVRVAEQFIISNIGDRAVVPDANGEPALLFDLPQAAGNLVFQEGQLGDRYIASEEGFGDLRAVLPGQNSYQQLFAYDLVYNSGIKLPISLNLPARSVVVLLPVAAVSLSNPDFLEAGSQEIQGATYQTYVSNGAHFTGDEITLSLSGPNPAGSVAFSFLNDDKLLFGLAALAVAVGAVWVWLLRMPSFQSPERIIDEIVALDRKFEGRQIKAREYKQRRNNLKKHLRLSLNKK